MRTMLRITVPVEAGNRAVKDGSLPKMIEGLVAKLKPEATYFVTEKGTRSALVFFDLRDSSDIPVIAEPLFIGLNATLEFYPAMNGDDLRKGLSAVMQAI